MKNMYVNQLVNGVQKEIEKDLLNALTELGLTGEELEEGIENGMNSKLSDLEYTININKYL